MHQQVCLHLLYGLLARAYTCCAGRETTKKGEAEAEDKERAGLKLLVHEALRYQCRALNPDTCWQGDNKGEAEAEDEERGKKENDGEEREEDGDKEAGKEALGPPIASQKVDRKLYYARQLL